MDGTTIFFTVFAISMLASFAIFETSEQISYYRSHKNFIDDDKPIQNRVDMEIYCTNRKYGIWCWVCPYTEECKKYELRYKHYPNGDVDKRRKFIDDNKGDKNDRN